MPNQSLALVTHGGWGWTTVRERWESDLAYLDPLCYHIEDYAKAVFSFTQRFGGKSIGHATAGRVAAQAAIRDGARVLLLTTLQNAPLLPLRYGVRYVVYGDLTWTQHSQIYNCKRLGFPGSWIMQGIRRLAKHGAIFLCASAKYREALRAEFGILEHQLIDYPLYVDTEIWKPTQEFRPRARPQVLFIGADLHRKGGDIFYELAKLFPAADFHAVSPIATSGAPNLHPHCNMQHNSLELANLIAKCDVYVLPTRADASPIAILEAGACGLPAITTAKGAISEIVLDGVTGTLLKEPSVDGFAAALSTYLSNPEMCRCRGQAARDRVERHFSKNRLLPLLDSVIKQELTQANANRSAALRL